MTLDYVAVRFANQGRACLRELNGLDETAVFDSFTPTAIRLLDRLLVKDEGCVLPGESASLTAFDRDRLLAAVYRRAFADRINSTTTCRTCAERFDLDFSLTELAATLESQRTRVDAEWADGYFSTKDGAVFRLPTGREECEAALTPRKPGALAAALIAPESRPLTADELDALLDHVAPLLDLCLDAHCPECGHEQQVGFSVQSYLLESLLGGRRRLVVDVHRIAVAYGWTRQEILALPRTIRKQHVELIDAERPGRQRILQ